MLAVCEREQPVGVVIQFGGQTPLKLARAIEAAGFRILGTPYDAIDLAEDRERFGAARWTSSACAARSGGSRTRRREAVEIAERIGYPVLVRPRTCSAAARCASATTRPQVRAAMAGGQRAPVLVDRFLENAIEIDVDALCDGATRTSPRSWSTSRRPASTRATRRACCRRPRDDEACARSRVVRRLGPALGVVGLLNVQLALADGEVYVLEVNPRASRTVPFASKATGVNLVDAACRLAAGARLPSSACRPSAGPSRSA